MWEELEVKLEGSKEAQTLVNKTWLKNLIMEGLRFGVVSEENNDIIAAGEDKGNVVFLYLSFDTDDNTVDYIVAAGEMKLANKVKSRLEVLVK